MVTRLIKRPPFPREWRRAKKAPATSLADRLGIERESYYRLERDPSKFNAGELAELAAALNIEPEALWRLPEDRPSLDAMVRNAPNDLKDTAADIVARLMARKTG